jgi:hypothetical protein
MVLLFLFFLSGSSDMVRVVLSLYRRLFGVVFLTNLTVLIVTAVCWKMNAQRLSLITLANIFTAVIIRQDYVINALFTIFTAVPPSCASRPFYNHFYGVLTRQSTVGLFQYEELQQRYTLSEAVSS